MRDDRPPFRAEHVGSLLRPAALVAARARHRSGQISAEELTRVEDLEIRRAIEEQRDIGLRLATDGEYRRTSWQWDFLSGLDGTEAVVDADQTRLRVVSKIGFSMHPMVDHFTYLAANVADSVTPKMTIPSPTMLVSARRDWRSAVAREAYRDIESLYADLGRAYADAVRAFAAAGCRYLQFDDCNLAYLCDPAHRRDIIARGDDPDALLAAATEMINTALEARGPDMVVSTHICRGNRRSTWFAEGGYEPIAETVFNAMNYDAYFLEYDTDRAGGFEPLRLFPKAPNKSLVLGLVTTKTGDMEAKDDLKRRIEQASQFVPMDQLCVSPQCGFASTEEGNELESERQWAKLELVVEVAEEMWG